MLIAYHEWFLYLIAVCSLFCILVVVYSLFNYLTQNMQTKRQHKKRMQVKESLECFADKTEKEKKKVIRRISRIIRTPRGLLALLEALDELGWMRGELIPCITRQMLCDRLTEISLKHYRREADYIQGLLFTLYIRCDNTSSRLKDVLLKNLDSSHLLVRIEALRCVCAQRNRKLVVNALRRFNKRTFYFDNKLITDTLMTYTGDRGLLAEELWKEMQNFQPEIQVSILHFMSTIKDCSFASDILELVKNEKADKEVHIAAMKYFGEVHVEECVPVLAEFLKSEEWEYAAVAASVLNQYDCQGIFNVLLQGISNRNWYVRSNCARTIVNACSAQQINEALNSSDRYGCDSVRYALKTMKKEESAG